MGVPVNLAAVSGAGGAYRFDGVLVGTYTLAGSFANYQNGTGNATVQDGQVILDEPLNGLDPMARADVIGLFRALAGEGLHVIISSHILHEVDRISDQVVLLSNGYVVAEGQIQAVRGEMHQEHPLQILLRCTQPGAVAARLFTEDHVAEVRMHADRQGLLVSTRDPDLFYGLLNRMVVDGVCEVESVAPADDDVHSVYQYLIGAGGGPA